PPSYGAQRAWAPPLPNVAHVLSPYAVQSIARVAPPTQTLAVLPLQVSTQDVTSWVWHPGVLHVAAMGPVKGQIGMEPMVEQGSVSSSLPSHVWGSPPRQNVFPFMQLG